MKTNKITATIVIEIEDNRMGEYRATHPINKKLIEKNIDLRLNKCFVPYHFSTAVIKSININETFPLTEAQIKYYLSCVAIDDALCKLYDHYNDAMNPQRGYGEIPSLYDYLDNWNWRQDCNN